MSTAILCGGPMNGEVWQVEDNRHTLVTMQMPESTFDPRPSDVIEPVRTVYVRRTLSFFGAPLYAWTPDHTGDSREAQLEVAASVGAHILNPLGLALLKEGASQ